MDTYKLEKIYNEMLEEAKKELLDKLYTQVSEGLRTYGFADDHGEKALSDAVNIVQTVIENILKEM